MSGKIFTIFNKIQIGHVFQSLTSPQGPSPRDGGADHSTLYIVNISTILQTSDDGRKYDGSHIFMLPSSALKCSGGIFFKELVTFEIAHIRRSTPWSLLHGNEHQCINTFKSQYHSVQHHSLHGANIIHLLTSLKATCPYFSSCQKLGMEKFISNQT